MPNRFNYTCPKCGSADHIVINAVVAVHLTRSGPVLCEQIGPDNWGAKRQTQHLYSAECDACGFSGKIPDFEQRGSNVVPFFRRRR